jgi:hypothetical protein
LNRIAAPPLAIVARSWRSLGLSFQYIGSADSGITMSAGSCDAA